MTTCSALTVPISGCACWALLLQAHMTAHQVYAGCNLPRLIREAVAWRAPGVRLSKDSRAKAA
jgi:hypothetical protein